MCSEYNTQLRSQCILLYSTVQMRKPFYLFVALNLTEKFAAILLL